MTARNKPVRKRRWPAVILLIALVLALLYFLRFGGFGVGDGKRLVDRAAKALQIDTPTIAIDAAVPNDGAVPQCRILINAQGLSIDGKLLSTEEAVSACRASGVAELVVAGTAIVAQVEETSAALRAADIEVREIHKQPEDTE